MRSFFRAVDDLTELCLVGMVSGIKALVYRHDMAVDYKRYTMLEDTLQKINGKYIALPDSETKRNNRLLQVIRRIIQSMKSKNQLFDNLYQNIFYGGSYYDGLKVGKPCEYDLDLVLCLPKNLEPTVQVTDEPGYAKLLLKNFESLKLKREDARKYAGIDKLLSNGFVSTSKVKSWIESVMTSRAKIGLGKAKIGLGKSECVVRYKILKNGPALTIKLEGAEKGTAFEVDIDLVPCFTFDETQWPKGNYRKNSTNRDRFFLVPKSPATNLPLYWRLSFQEQEKEIIGNNFVLKPTVKLIKKIRDRFDHNKIASYFIKTVFLWELDKGENIWTQPLSFVLVTMLKRYAYYLEQGNIPNYWNKNHNLIYDLGKETTSCYANKIKKIVDDFDRICNDKSDPNEIISCFLKAEEINIEDFKNVGIKSPKKIG